MSDEKALSGNEPPTTPPLSPVPEEPLKPIDSGPIYIGNSNTRGVVMQVHLHRFQQALASNHAGLAAMAAWLALGRHHWIILLGCVAACLYSIQTDRLWIHLIQDTITNLTYWNMQLNQMMNKLGVKDYLPPGATIERPEAKVSPQQLYRPLRQCIVAWAVLLVAAAYQFSQTEEIKPWTSILLQSLSDYLRLVY
jgi:hypothetical protein